jgi:hypothetical protein
MNAPLFPPNPTPGMYFQNWVWSGSRWVCTNSVGTRVITTVFNASAPYTPSPGLVSVVVETTGGGGGGGPCAGDAVTLGGGGGGGSGGFSRITLAAALVLGGVNVTIGAGGTGNVPTEFATDGTATSFGSMCVANGGKGGELNDSTSAWGGGGAGAPVGVGDIAYAGNPGQPGTSQVLSGTDVNVYGGAGGFMFGGGAQSLLAGVGLSTVGANGNGPGAGGSGAAVNGVLAARAGGQGGAGICVVTEYCWADAFDTGCGCCPPSGSARVAIGSQWGGQGFDND